jgi:hypothetical protein
LRKHKLRNNVPPDYLTFNLVRDDIIWGRLKVPPFAARIKSLDRFVGAGPVRRQIGFHHVAHS